MVVRTVGLVRSHCLVGPDQLKNLNGQDQILGLEMRTGSNVYVCTHSTTLDDFSSVNKLLHYLTLSSSQKFLSSLE